MCIKNRLPAAAGAALTSVDSADAWGVANKGDVSVGIKREESERIVGNGLVIQVGVKVREGGGGGVRAEGGRSAECQSQCP